MKIHYELYTPPLPPNATYFEIQANNTKTGSYVTTFSATINGTEYNTTNGTITTAILENSTQLWNVSVYTYDGVYVNATYLNLNVSSDLLANLSVYPRIFIYSNMTDALVSGNISIDGSNYTGASSHYVHVNGSYQANVSAQYHWPRSVTQSWTYNNDYNVTLNAYPLITTYNAWNYSQISGFSAWINSTEYTTTDTELYIPLESFSSYTLAKNGSDYMNRTISESISMNNAYNRSMYHSEIIVLAQEIITGNNIMNWTLQTEQGSNATTSYNLTLYPNLGNYSWNWTNALGYFNKINYAVEIVSGTTSVNISDIYDSVLNVTAQVYNGSSITNFTANISGTYSHTDSVSTTNGSAYFYLLQGMIVNITIDAPGYEIPNATTDVEINDTYIDVTFYLYTTNSINFTFLDEETGDLILNVSIELISDIFSGNYSTTTGYLYLDLLSPSLYAIRYVSEGYNERFYYFNLQNRSHTDLTLYLLANSSATEVTATVYDEGSYFVEDAYIKSLRYDLATNSYIVMEIVRTNFEGQAKLNLVLNEEFYKFIVEYPQGTVKEETSPTYIYGTTLNFQINLGEDVGQNFFNSRGITHSLTFNNATNNFRFTYTDANNIMEQGCLEVYWIRALEKTLINRTCTASSTATILINVDNITGRTYKATGYVYFDSTRYNLIELIQEFDEESPAGQFGVFLIFFLTVVFAFMGIWSKAVALIITPIPIFFGSVLNIIDFPIGLAISIEAVCIIIAIWLSKRGS